MGFQQVNSSKFSINVGRLLREYSDEVAVACKVCTEETASNMVDELKTYNVGKHTKRKWKKFPRAWTYTLKQHADGRVEGTVHLKKPYYRIGHLLEFGHAVENGGRTPIAEGKKTSVEGDDFIRPIAEKYEKQYEQKMKEMIGVVV